jgi:putative acetyltransferase
MSAILDAQPASASLRIAIERPDQPEIIALIDALDAYQRPLYPPESHHGVDIATLLQPGVTFVVARDADGRALGCGAVMRLADAEGVAYGEVKRMYVQPEQRGRGIAQRLLGVLESHAEAQECMALRLETGPRQPEALRLYERAGFLRRGPFGDYWDDPHSVFLEKRLGPLRIDRLPAPGDDELRQLAELLHACVHAGASVHFVLPFGPADALAFWQRQLPALHRGARALLVARERDGGRIVGTVQLVLDQPPNGAHRAEVAKLLVHPDARRRGAARALMHALEGLARAEQRTLLVLDTNEDSPAERLYASLGFHRIGVVPGYARSVEGGLRGCSFMYKPL